MVENVVQVCRSWIPAACSRAMLISIEHASVGEVERTGKHALPGQFDPRDLEDRSLLKG